MNLKARLIKLNWLLTAQFGVDLKLMVLALRGLPRYCHDLTRFNSRYQGKLTLVPCLHDWYQEGGSTKSEYFWQDLLVAQMIYRANPRKHVDIGSRVDGFVAHVASFRELEVFDVRPIASNVPNVIFRQADLMSLPEDMVACCDSLSCLHALEHFGLGRYNDPLNPEGYRDGLENMAKLLKTGGLMYLSVPIGIERVEFNANRVFDPRKLLVLAKTSSLELMHLNVVSQGGGFRELEITDANLTMLAQQSYSLGIFVFRKCGE